MRMYFCRWPNGDFSAVHAASKLDAIISLDEVGDATQKEVFAVKHFMVHFKLRLPEDVHQSFPEFEVESFGERNFRDINSMYPELDEAQERIDRIYGQQDNPDDSQMDEMRQLLTEAFNRERGEGKKHIGSNPASSEAAE